MANRLLGVISALPEEFAHLSDQSGDAREIGGLAFWRGEIAGREAIFVESGVGDVVVSVSHTQHDYGTQKEDSFRTIQPGSRPSLGGDWTPGYRVAEPLLARLREALKGLELEPLPEAVGAGRRLPSVHFGAILTGDVFVNAESLRRRLHEQFEAHAVEMEGGRWRRSRSAGARTFRSSTCAVSATSPVPRAISISAPSCRSPRATPRRSPTGWRR
jgi:adenosylhomocysteine nucleosidase